MIGMSSTWLAVKGFSIQESIEKLFEMGFDLVEIGAGHKYEEGAIETVMKLRKKYHSKKFTIHASFPPIKNGNNALNLADPKEHERTVRTIKRMFDIADMTSAMMVGIHGGFASEAKWIPGKFGFEDLVAKKIIPIKEAKINMKIVLEDILTIVEERNIKLAIEISPPDKSRPMMINPQIFDWMFSTFDSPNLGLLLDIGHLHNSAMKNGYDPFEFTERFKNKIFEIHVHDCANGEEHYLVGTGEVDFKKHFGIIGKKKLEELPLVFEYKNNITEKQCLEGKQMIEKIISEL